MLRTILFWVHLCCGVLAGALILVMSATGVLLTYEKQITHWADIRHIHVINSPASQQLSADSLIALASVGHKAPASAISLRADGSEPAQVSFGREGVVLLHPVTGAVVGTGSTSARSFFRSVEDWHRWLAREGPGRGKAKSAMDAANLLFLVLVLSGMVLWLPKTWTWIRVRAVLLFRSGLSGKARDFNWHNVLGIWSALPLVLVVASGVVIGYPWASDLVFTLSGEKPPARAPQGGPPGGPGAPGGPAGSAAPAVAGAPAVPYGVLIGNALPLMPDWKSVTLQVPKPGAKTVSVTLDRGTGGQPQHRATVQLAAATGAVASYQPFDSLSAGRKARSVLRFLHTGEVLGMFGQTIAGLVTLASVVLVITGISLSIRRASRALGRRDRPAAAGSAA